MDVAVYIYESIRLPELKFLTPVAVESDFKLGQESDARTISTDITFSEAVKHNGTLFAHIFVSKHSRPVDPRDSEWKAGDSYNFVKPLTRYLPAKKVVRTKKLLTSASEEEKAAEAARDREEEALWKDPKTGRRLIKSYWHSNLTLDVVPESGVLNYPALAPVLKQHISLEQSGARDTSGQNGWYYPIVWVNDFWLLRDHMVELNSTVSSLPLHVTLNPSAWWKFNLMASMDASFKQSAANPNPAFGQTENTGSELEEFKRVLIETNIWLLGTTFVVSILHTVLEMLAFKEDVQHWRKKKDNVGVSLRTILANVFMQSVIFLYLLDNNEDTSWMIMFGQGFGIFLEAWKITRVVDVSFTADPNSVFGYRLSIKDKHVLSELEKETKKYDEEAFWYMGRVAIPLLIAYAVYSLMYEEHKSMYSFGMDLVPLFG